MYRCCMDSKDGQHGCAFYNFVRIHTTIETTPAVDAGLTDLVWTVGKLLERIAELTQS